MKCFRIFGRGWFGLCLAVASAAGCSGSVAVPTAYDAYKSKDQSFAVDYPQGWNAAGGGQSGFASARFTSGSASIKVTADTVGSVVGDIAKSMNRMAGDPEDDELKPITKVHAMGKQAMAEEFGNYQEQAPTALSTSFGEAKLAEFTGSGSFGGKYHGYRLTALSVDRRITIVCCAREADWSKLKPAFDKVNASLRHGR